MTRFPLDVFKHLPPRFIPMEALEATVRDLNQRLYGTKSEKSVGPDQAGRSKPTSARPRRV